MLLARAHLLTESTVELAVDDGGVKEEDDLVDDDDDAKHKDDRRKLVHQCRKEHVVDGGRLLLLIFLVGLALVLWFLDGTSLHADTRAAFGVIFLSYGLLCMNHVFNLMAKF